MSRLSAAAPRYVEPMKARLESRLPQGGGWIFEVKLDGIRAIAVKNGKEVGLWSRRPRDMTAEYPQIADAVAALPVRSAVLDGEIVALEKKGRSSFQAWQNARGDGSGKTPLYYYAFDLLQVEGRNVTGLPFTQRRAALTAILAGQPDPLRLSPLLKGTAARVWKQAVKLGLEGVIAKRRDSPYEAGRRSGAWLKIKRQNEQEFVLGGFTPPRGSRKHFGALLLGVYEGAKLKFVSRVGTGFDADSLESLHRLFRRCETRACPFSNLPTRRAGKIGQGLTAADMRRCVWLEPRLVCQVRFLEWTGDGSLRQPVFLGLREDKKPREVVRDMAA